MAKDIQDRVGQLLSSDSARALAGTAVTELLKGIGAKDDSGGGSRNGGVHPPRALSGMRGIAAGAGAAALAPAAVKGIGKLVRSDGGGSLADAPKNLARDAASKVGDTVSGKVKDKVDEAGGASGILKDTVKSALPFGGGGGGKGKQDAQGVGKGRRMPIQQSIDIGLPIETVYNQWTQLEEWPKFMHRVRRVSQEDPCKAAFTVKIWGKSKEFTAEIETQRPDDRIKWKTTEGMNVAGVVTFRELAPNLTRVQLSFDVDPGGLLEKYARGARYVKRAARADLHRFAAFIEMLEHETGAWRGVIEDGKVVEDHDPSYDKKREYSSADELLGASDEDGEDESDQREQRRGRGRNGGDPGERRSRSGGRRQSGGGRSGSGSSRSSAQARRSTSRTSGKSTSGRSSSGRSSGSSSSGRSSGSSSSGRSSGSSSSGRSSGSSSRGRSSGSSSGSSRSRTANSSRSSASGRTRSRSSGRS